MFYELSGGLNTRGSSAEYKRIFMGRAWPPDPRLARMRRELPAMKDIWLVELAHESGPLGRTRPASSRSRVLP